MKDIEVLYDGQRYVIPNRWESMSSSQYLKLVEDLMLMTQGQLSAGEVRINYLCEVMGWRKNRFRTEEQIANLVALSEQLTFLFKIEYPDDNSILADLDRESYEMCSRVDPFRLSHPLARVLKRLDYRYVVDLCFAAQLLPTVTIDGKTHAGYTFNAAYDRITCSLTALQYIEARDLIDKNADALPLLAAILYFPAGEVYSSEAAHKMADDFANLPEHILAAILFNFQAVNTFLFTKTPLSLLTNFVSKKSSLISTDASDALYDLSRDGLGDARQVEQMNVLTYFKILRKKTIDAVKDMHGMGWDKLKISNEVGLPISIIDKIL